MIVRTYDVHPGWKQPLDYRPDRKQFMVPQIWIAVACFAVRKMHIAKHTWLSVKKKKKKGCA